MKSAVFALVPTSVQTESIIDELRLANFSRNDVSVLFPEMESESQFSHVTPGIILGDGVNWLVGLGSLAIPGTGSLIAAGPIFSALSETLVYAGDGELDVALTNLGFSEYEARVCARKLHEGSILIAVHTENNHEARVALKIFERSEIRDFGVTHDVAELQPAALC